jgi:hypothetical protein
MVIPKDYYFKTEKSYVIVHKDNYSQQLKVYTHPEHGKVYGWIDNNTGTRFPEYLLNHARLLARDGGLVIEVSEEKKQ